MPFRYLEDLAVADAAFEATGETVEEMFLAAAHATVTVMVECPEEMEGEEKISFALEEGDLEMLLFDFLQEILYLKDARKLLPYVESVDIDMNTAPMRLAARARCGTIESHRERLLTDVKAVTLHRFGIRRDECGWTATVVLDV